MRRLTVAAGQAGGQQDQAGGPDARDATLERAASGQRLAETVAEEPRLAVDLRMMTCLLWGGMHWACYLTAACWRFIGDAGTIAAFAIWPSLYPAGGRVAITGY